MKIIKKTLRPIHKLLLKIKYFISCYQGYIYRKRVRKKTDYQNVVFIVCYPQGWNSLKTVFNDLKSRGTKVILVACIGYPYANNNATFWKSIDEDAIIVNDGSDCIPLEELNASIVFKQTPYNDEYPEMYSSRNISKTSKLCYIPYGYEPSPLKHLQIEYNDSFFPFVYAIYCDNNTTKDFCDNKANNNVFTKDILLFNYGYPRFDLGELQLFNGKYNTFLWLPRWSLDNVGNDGSSFFLFNEHLINYFSVNKDKNLIIRPHPLMFNNFLKHGAMSKEDINKYKERILNIKNIYLDETPNYLESFNKSDVLISDFSSLVIEYFMSGKPVIYCGDDSEFNAETKKMINSSYKVSSWEDLALVIDDLILGNDIKLEERNNIIISFKKDKDGFSSTQKISDSIKNI